METTYTTEELFGEPLSLTNIYRDVRNEVLPDPLRYIAAGAAQNFTLLPALAGYAGSAWEAGMDKGLRRIEKKYRPEAAQQREITDPELGYVDSFKKAQESGIDRSLAETGEELTDDLWENLDVPRGFPKNWLNQLALVTGTWMGFPLPSKFLTSPLGVATMFATPAVRMSKGAKPFDKAFKIRLGTQLGVGTALDQGIRAYTDEPLVFSKEALSAPLDEAPASMGEMPIPPQEEAPGPGAALDTDHMGLLKAGLEEVLGVKSAKAETITTDELFSSPTSTTITTDELLGGPVTITTEDLIPGTKFNPELARREQAAEDADSTEWQEYARNIIAGTVAAYVALRYRNHLRHMKTGPHPTGTEPVPVVDLVTDIGRHIRGTGKRWPSKGGWSRAKEVGGYLWAELGTNVRSARQAPLVALKRLGYNAEEMKDVPGEEFIDYPGVLVDWLRTGVFPLSGSRLATPIKQMIAQFRGWAPERQQEFTNYLMGLRANADRTRATAHHFLTRAEAKSSLTPEQARVYKEVDAAYSKGSLDDVEEILANNRKIIDDIRGTPIRERPSLWKVVRDPSGRETKVFVEDAELAEWVKLGQKDAEFIKMRKQFAEAIDGLLQEAVDLGVWSEAWAKAIRHSFSRTLDPAAGREVVYMPTSESTTRGLFGHLADLFGSATTSGKHWRGVSSALETAKREGEGIAQPMGIFENLVQHASAMMEHIGRSVDQWNFLTKLSGLKVHADGSWEVAIPKIIKGFAGRTLIPKFLGRYRVDAQNPGKMVLELNKAEEVQKMLAQVKLLGKEGDQVPYREFPRELDEMARGIVVQYKGDFYIFGGLSHAMKEGLEFSPAMVNGFDKFHAFFTRLMTRGTTGILSPFAPISHLYNDMLGSVVTLMKLQGGIGRASKEAIQLWRDGFLGTYDIFVRRMSNDYALMFTHGLKTNTGFFSLLPKHVQEAFQKKLAERAAKTLLPSDQNISRYIGGTRTGYGDAGPMSKLIGTDKSWSKLLEDAIPAFSRYYGANAVPQFIRAWKYWNEAWHEGTKFGLIARKLSNKEVKAELAQAKGPEIGKIVRRETAAAQEVLTEPRNIGAWMKWAQAFFPFFSPFVSAITTFGRAAQKFGFKKSMAALTAGVLMPSALEFVWNTTLMPNARFTDKNGRVWSYKEWWWGHLSSAQRTDNAMFFLPGVDPWDTPYVRALPEFAPFRGMVFDALELLLDPTEYREDHGADHLWHGFGRAFHLPNNPWWSAVASWMGVNLDTVPEIGPHQRDISGEMDPDISVSLIRPKPLPGINVPGNRATGGDAGRRYVGEEMTVKAHAILANLFGAIGQMGIDMYENYWGGVPTTPQDQRTQAAVDIAKRSIRQQAPYLSFFGLGNVFSKAPTPEVTRALLAKVNALEKWTKRGKLTPSKGTMSAEGKQFLGKSVSAPTDPVIQELGARSQSYLDLIAVHRERVSDLRRSINHLATALNLLRPWPPKVEGEAQDYSLGYEGEWSGEQIPAGPITVEQRAAITNDINTHIDRINIEALRILEEQEKAFFETYSIEAGVDMRGQTFEGIKERTAPFTLPDSTSPAPPTSPQTSQ